MKQCCALYVFLYSYDKKGEDTLWDKARISEMLGHWCTTQKWFLVFYHLQQTRAPFQYPIRHLIINSQKASKPRDGVLNYQIALKVGMQRGCTAAGLLLINLKYLCGALETAILKGSLDYLARLLHSYFAEIILCMHPANERRRYNVTLSLIGWVHPQNDPCCAQIIAPPLAPSRPWNVEWCTPVKNNWTNPLKRATFLKVTLVFQTLFNGSFIPLSRLTFTHLRNA